MWWCVLLPLVIADDFHILDSTKKGFIFEGNGGLSAGASSRLLIDYEEPQRSQVLDYLFLPNFGLASHIVKVEIGGDDQSTDGDEPSHMHFRGEVNCYRGYEWWLMLEARKRNPSIITWGLAWGVPGWVGNGSYFSDDNIDYHVKWLQCASERGLTIDRIGIWNERSWGTVEYVKALRQALDQAGFANTSISLPDNPITPELYSSLNSDPAFAKAVYSVGAHYACVPTSEAFGAAQKVRGMGIPVWSSEDYSVSPDWAGASKWGRILVNNYVRMNMTSTVAWALIWSVLPGLVFSSHGLMVASEPWSGHYEVSGSIWTGAHTNQFTQPGWYFLAGEASGKLSNGATFVTYMQNNITTNPNFSIVISSLNQGECGPDAPIVVDTTVTFALQGALRASKMYLWVTCSYSDSMFQPQGTIPVVNATFSVLVEPDCLYTLSTLSSAQHGDHGIPPPSRSFPFPYSDNFEGVPLETAPKYFSDQYGTFVVRLASDNSSNQVLTQVTPLDPGPNGWVANGDPLTLVGTDSLSDYTVSARARFTPPKLGYPQQVSQVAMSPCAPVETQYFQLDQPLQGNLRSLAAPSMCMEVHGCDPSMIDLWPCCSNCGCRGDDNLKWSLNGSAFVSRLDNECLSASPLGLVKCDSSQAQLWSMSPQGQLKNGLGLCLEVVVPAPFVGVCARMTNFDGFTVATQTNGYCLFALLSGIWQLKVGENVLASGSGVDWTNSTWHSLAVKVQGTAVVAVIDDRVVGQATDKTYTQGLAAVKSAYLAVEFDDFSLS